MQYSMYQAHVIGSVYELCMQYSTYQAYVIGSVYELPEVLDGPHAL